MSALMICLVAYAGVFAVLGFLVLCIKCLKWFDPADKIQMKNS